MFREFLNFDLRYQWRSPLLWITATVFFLLAFAATSTDAIQLGGSIGNVNRNAPYVIASFFGLFTVIGMFIVAAFVAQPLLRDAEMRTDELFFAKPLRKRDYIWGRWTAGVVAGLCAYVFAGLGMALGSAMPWLDPERVGPFMLRPFVWSFAVLVVPNLVFVGALLALLAATTRKLLAVYVGVIAFFVLWLIAQQMTSDVEYRNVAALIDPFGVEAFAQTTRYWSAHERNTQLPELAGKLLANRALWLGVAIVLIALTHALFKPMRSGTRSARRWRKQLTAAGAVESSASRAHRATTPSRDSNSQLPQFVHQWQFDLRGVLRSVPFLIIVVFSMFNLGGSLPFLDALYGTSVHPVTSLMLELIRGSFAFLLVLIVAYYGGELVWRERDAKMHEIVDALPVRNWVPMAAKAAVLVAVVLIFLAIGAATTIVFQLISGYTNLEPLAYLSGLAILAVPFVLMALASMFLQVVSNQKFLGYLLFIVFLVVMQLLPTLGLENNLYAYASSSGAPYSDMNGYGHFLKGWGWFNAYWSMLAIVLLLIAAAFWPRGLGSGWRHRLRNAQALLTRGSRVALVSASFAFVALGVWIFYNTHVLNDYVPRKLQQDRQARYEKSYRQYICRSPRSPTFVPTSTSSRNSGGWRFAVTMRCGIRIQPRSRNCTFTSTRERNEPNSDSAPPS